MPNSYNPENRADAYARNRKETLASKRWKHLESGTDPNQDYGGENLEADTDEDLEWNECRLYFATLFEGVSSPLLLVLDNATDPHIVADLLVMLPNSVRYILTCRPYFYQALCHTLASLHLYSTEALYSGENKSKKNSQTLVFSPSSLRKARRTLKEAESMKGSKSMQERTKKAKVFLLFCVIGNRWI
jgi:hypothetical protein